MRESGPEVSFRDTESSVREYGKRTERDFPGGPVVRTPRCHCREPRFNPWSGN